MIHIKTYNRAASLEDAYKALISHKKNCILGGMMWLRMQDKMVNEAIDLSDLGLDYIEEKEEFIEIGAMTPLRKLEESTLLQTYFGDAFKEALVHIVGTQFRNTATIGGSIWSKFGFSDPITLFLALETEVVLYKAGTLSLEEFLALPTCKDLLVKLRVKKEKLKLVYMTQRLTQTDFPNITVCLSKRGEVLSQIVVGARPACARRAHEAVLAAKAGKSPKEIAETAMQELSFGSNMRASKAYRMQLSCVYIERALEQLQLSASEKK